MKTIRILFVLSLAGMIFSGCSREDADGENVTERVPVRFGAAIAKSSRTTDGGNTWVAGDQVRIFMLTAGGSTSTAEDILASQVQYGVTDPVTGALAPTNGIPIYYPPTGNVDFIAYHTANEQGIDPSLQQINITGQTSEQEQNNLDILYAKTSGVAKSADAVELTFRHLMSRLTLNVKAGTGFTTGDISNLNASSVVIDGMPVYAFVGMQEGSTTHSNILGAFNPVKAAAAPTGYDATFTAILIPDGGKNGRTVAFTVGGQPYTWNISSTDIFESGVHYIYPVTVNKNGVVVGAQSIADWTVHDNESGTATLVE